MLSCATEIIKRLTYKADNYLTSNFLLNTQQNISTIIQSQHYLVSQKDGIVEEKCDAESSISKGTGITTYHVNTNQA